MNRSAEPPATSHGDRAEDPERTRGVVGAKVLVVAAQPLGSLSANA
jgi:hypothetical protein